jgi:plastocyanin
MRIRTAIVLVAVLGTPLLAGAAMSAVMGDPPGVNIDNFSFAPGALVVAAGTKVTWTNRDDIPHTVTDAAGKMAFRSAALDTGDVFSHVFDTPGTYRYFCSLHPRMQGTVVVR